MLGVVLTCRHGLVVAQAVSRWLPTAAAPVRVRAACAVSIPDEVIGSFNGPNPSSLTTALGSTQPLTEMSTRNLARDKGWSERKADNLTAISEPIWLENVGALTSHNPMGLNGLFTWIVLHFYGKEEVVA
jgi:hypothetical protein